MKNNEVLGDFILGGGEGGGGGGEGKEKGKNSGFLPFFESRTSQVRASIGRPGTGNRSKRPSNSIHDILTQHP